MTVARLWRLILMQRADGSWDSSDSLAFALGAHAGPLSSGKASLSQMMARVFTLAETVNSSGDAVKEFSEFSEDDRLCSGDEEAIEVQQEELDDSPLTYRQSTIQRRMPPQLAAFPQPEKLWCTLLATSHLQTLPICMLRGSDNIGDQETLVDAGSAYLLARSAADPALAALMQTGKMQAAAARALRRWALARAEAIERARFCKEVAKHKSLHMAQRAMTQIVQVRLLSSAYICSTDSRRAPFIQQVARTNHPTLSIFLDSQVSMARWMRFFTFFSLLLSALLVSIMFYSQRASSCCLEIRSLLQAGAGASCFAMSPPPQPPPPLPPPPHARVWKPPPLSPLAPASALECDPATPAGVCMGYQGSCAELASQFAHVPGAYVYGPPGQESCHATLADYVCHAFPDDSIGSDQIYVALISMVVMLPVSLGLQLLCQRACEIFGAQNGWLAWGPLLRILFGGGMRAPRMWHWSGVTRHRPWKLVRWLAIHQSPFFYQCVIFFTPLFVRRLIGLVLRGRRAPEPPPPPLGVPPPFRKQSPEEEETATDVPRDFEAQAKRSWIARLQMILGFYIAWALMSYFCFVYALIIYKCLSSGSENKFVEAWGISQALDQAKQLQGLIKGAVVASFYMVIFDALRLTTHARWWDDYLDFASCQATLFAEGASSFWQQLRKTARFHKRLQ